MSRHCLGRLLPFLLLVSCVLWSSAASAQDPDELAQRHFEAGVSYLQQSDHERALQEFQRSFELSNRPEVLLNVATVHERMGNLEQAIEALEGYLALEPEGKHAATVKIRIENLKKRLPDEDEAGPKPAEPKKDAAAEPKAEQAQPPPAQAPPPEPEAGPDRTLAYIVLGGAGVLAAGATVTGIMANGEHSDLEGSCAPYCNSEQTSRGRTLSLVSTILTGAAVVAAAGGVYLWMSAGDSDEKPVASGAPRLDLDVAKDEVRASAAWSF